MESKIINFLPKPKIKVSDLEYICDTKEVYINLFEIILHKELKLYKYPYEIEPEIFPKNRTKIGKIFGEKTVINVLNKFYGINFYLRDSIYGTKRVIEDKIIEKIQRWGSNEYKLIIHPFINEMVIKQEDIYKDNISKKLIEMIISDILHGNPHLKFYKGLFVMKNEKQKIETDKESVTLFPGYTTSFMETEEGNFLNVILKNKIISNDNVLQFMKKNGFEDLNNREKIKDLLINRAFSVCYGKKNYIIKDIIFDKNPVNQIINFNGKSISLCDYYKEKYNLEIEDKNQPLIFAGEKYFIPELSNLWEQNKGIEKYNKFMEKLVDFTNFDPDYRIKRINQFLNLFNCDERAPKNRDKLSAKERTRLYNIEIKPFEKLIKAYYMEEPKLIGGGGKEIKISDKIFPTSIIKKRIKWVCFYLERNYNDAEKLFKSLKKSSVAYDFYIEEPQWVEMSNKSKASDWIETVDEYVGILKNDFDFVVFLIGEKDCIYPEIKKHFLCEMGYINQVIKIESLRKNEMDVCSEILLQINDKLRGILYKIKLDEKIKNRKLMIIGIDSRPLKKGNRARRVAMVSSINDSFTNFLSDEITSGCVIYYPDSYISCFIDKAFKNFKNSLPEAIIIYRQGVSFNQKKIIKEEIRQIEYTCKTKNIRFYYILVNTKTNYKFFERRGKTYSNPSPGLLIIDGITSKNYFKFFIQPQDERQGIATPTCYHVVYGNLDIPEMIPKLTYDLCHIYSNWQGPVRIPNVLKAAEKLLNNDSINYWEN